MCSARVKGRQGKGITGGDSGKATDETALGTLEEQHRQLLSIFDGINEAIYVSDPETYEVLFVNEALRKIIGRDPVGKLCHREFQGKDSPCEFCTNKIIKGIKPRTHIWEHYNPELDRTFALHDRIFRWPDGRDVRVELAVDISDRKRAEDSLRESEENLRVTLNSIGDAVIATDTKGIITRMNPIAEKLTGWSFMEAKDKPINKVFNIFNSQTREPCRTPVEKVVETGRIIGLANHTMLKSKDGEEYQIADSGAPIKNDLGHTVGVVMVFRDVSLEHAMQAQLIHSQKLEALGMLAGGIAHDFNNLLVGVYGYIDLARAVTDVPEVEDCLNSAMKSLERARALTSQMLTFARGGVPHRKAEYLFPFLKEATNFALSGSNVSCRFKIPDDLYPSICDRNQIEQVIGNIVINAQQAMRDGGTIRMSAQNCLVESGNHLNLSNGQYVRISISDNGPGMVEDVAKRIFDPFFSTKAKGQGLGLATAYSIIKRHDGAIDVESEPGHGSTFHVYIPGAEKGMPTAASSSGSADTGRILLLDDEEIVRNALAAMLKSLGYEAVTTTCGEEALEIFSKEHKAGRIFTAMIFDLTIPSGMGGKEAVIHVRKACPQIPIFVASGYDDDPVLADPAAFGFTACIRKPFTISELARMLDSFVQKD